MDFRVIIPARFHSTRLPGKALLDIAGKPMIQHVYERCLKSGAESVVIATDDTRIEKVCVDFGAQVCLTTSDHETGTDRIAEAVSALEYEPEEVVVDVQCDEPMIPPEAIRQLAEDLHEHENVKVSTFCEPITNLDDLFDPNVVKVVPNHRNYAIYFSRAPIPWERGNFDQPRDKVTLTGSHYRHVGMYAYRVGFLESYQDWTECAIETQESLEQLRILWHGGRIHMCVSNKPMPPGVDTEADLARIRALLEKKS